MIALNNMKEHNDLHEDVGFIKAKVEAIEKKVDKLNGTTSDNCKKLQKHEIILGKAGMIFVIIVFAITTALNFVIDWFKHNVFK